MLLGAWPPAPRELEELPDDADHLLRRVGDDPAVLARLLGRCLARGDHLGASHDDVQRRAHLVRDAGGQLAHRRQPIGVPELFERGDARRSLACNSFVRLDQAIAGRVHLVGDLGKLVSLRDPHGLREVTLPHAPRLGDERAGRASDEQKPEHVGDQRGRQGQYARRAHGIDDRTTRIEALGRERFGELERASSAR